MKQIFLSSLLLLSLASCADSEGATDSANPKEFAAKPALVEAFSTSTRTVSRPIHASGTTRPNREADLAPAMSARIEKIWVSKGQKVEKNARLVSLDSQTVRLNASQARASAAAVEAQAVQAESEYERLAPLAERGTIPQSRLKQLQTQRETAKAQANAAKAAALSADRVIQNAELRAPFSGTIAALPIEVGEMASMGPGSTLVRLIDLSQIKVSVQLGEAAIGQIAIGDNVKVFLASANKHLDGKVTEISSELDTSTRTGEVTVLVDNASGEIRAGLFAELEFNPAAQPRMLIPRGAIGGLSEASSYVLKIEGSTLARADVQVRPFDENFVELLSGVAPGTKIVKEISPALQSGAPVEVVSSQVSSRENAAALKASAQ